MDKVLSLIKTQVMKDVFDYVWMTLTLLTNAMLGAICFMLAFGWAVEILASLSTVPIEIDFGHYWAMAVCIYGLSFALLGQDLKKERLLMMGKERFLIMMVTFILILPA